MKTFYLFQLDNPIDCPNFPFCVNTPDLPGAPIDSSLGYLLFIGVVLAMIVLFKNKNPYKFKTMKTIKGILKRIHRELQLWAEAPSQVK